MPVNTGIGRNKMAKSVMILTGAEDRYKVTISVQMADDGGGSMNTAATG